MNRKGGFAPRILRGYAIAMIGDAPLKVKVVGDPRVLDRERVARIELPTTGLQFDTPVEGLVPVVEEVEEW